jgi:hypothetical protein
MIIKSLIYYQKIISIKNYNFLNETLNLNYSLILIIDQHMQLIKHLKHSF